MKTVQEVYTEPLFMITFWPDVIDIDEWRRKWETDEIVVIDDSEEGGSDD